MRRSVSATWKSCGGQPDAALGRRPPRADRSSGAADRRGHVDAAARRRTPTPAVAPVRSPACPASRRSWSPPRTPFVEAGEHPAQRGVAEPADRLGRELQLAAVAGQVALPLQLALQPAQRLQVVDRLAAERAADRFLVDVVQAGARVVLAERGLQVGEVGQLGDRAGRVAEAERLAAGHPHPALRAGRARAGRARSASPSARHLGRQARRPPSPGPSGRPAPRAARRTATASSRSAACIRRARESTSSSRFCGLSGNKSPYLPMKSSKSCCGVLAAGVGVEHLPQVGEHVLDPLHGRRVGVLAAPASCPGTGCRAPPGAAGRAAARTSAGPPATASRSPTSCRIGPRRCRSGSVSSSASRSRASSLGSGNSAPRSASSASSSSSRAWSSIPSSRPRVAQLALPLADPAQQVVEARAGPASRAAAGRAARRAGCRRPGCARPSRRAPPGRRTAAPAGPARRRQGP